MPIFARVRVRVTNKYVGEVGEEAKVVISVGVRERARARVRA